MMRMIGTRLILPKGDTGFFMLPTRGQVDKGDIAVFSVKNMQSSVYRFVVS